MKIDEAFAIRALEEAVINLIPECSRNIQEFIMHYTNKGLAEVVGDTVAKPAVMYCKADRFKIYLSVTYTWGGIQHRWSNSFNKKDMVAHTLPELVQVAVANIKADAKRTLELSGRCQNKNV